MDVTRSLSSLQYNGLRILDGLGLDKPVLNVLDAGGLKLDITNAAGGNLTFMIDGTPSVLDATTGGGAGGAARIALTAGTANVPVLNHVYVTDAAGVASLNVSSTLPTGAFAWVGKVLVPDAATFATTGAYGIQRYTEAFSNLNRGVLSHEREKMRASGAQYISGGTHAVNITGGGNTIVHLNIASAQVYQLHRQSFPAFPTGPYYYGNGTAPYTKVTDLGQILTDSTGAVITDNRRYCLVVWGAVNQTTGECKVYVNRPSGTYGNNNQAIADRDNKADYTVPDELHSIAFLIARVVLRYRTATGFTILGSGAYSLLGSPVGFRSGGSGAVMSNEFDDSVFRVFDNLDTTKQLAFETSGIATGTTRTLTISDNDGTIATYDTDGTLKISGQGYSDLPATLTPVGIVQTIDWNNGNGAVLDLASATGNVTLILINPKAGATYTIKVIQKAATPLDLIYSANVLWAGGGTPPIISIGASAVDLIVLYYEGTNYLGSINQDFS